jgi:hypothetical protein
VSEPFVFHRPALAKRLADTALGRDVFGSTAGLFLAAPRRTGKSTFLTVDLIPQLKVEGALPIYVDLWSDRGSDPAALIMEAVRTAAKALEGRLTKTMRRAGMSKVGVGSWLSVDVDRLGVPGGPTLAAALAHLAKASGKPVVLVVDETQHAITSKAGADAMFALKSARDTINISAPGSGAPWLGLVFTGSNRDKLASLVVGRSQPFFGSSVTDFPLLGRDYADAYTAYVNQRLAAAQRLDADEVNEAFVMVGSRPQLLQAAIKDHVFGVVGDTEPRTSLREQAIAAREGYWSEFDAHWAGLTKLQKAVLSRLVQKDDAFKPFEADALAAYAEDVGQPVGPGDAQSALDALREKGVVVRLERGRYTLDDAGMAEWHAARFGLADADENDGGDGGGGGASGGP